MFCLVAQLLVWFGDFCFVLEFFVCGFRFFGGVFFVYLVGFCLFVLFCLFLLALASPLSCAENEKGLGIDPYLWAFE